jgi:hypothetical protein
VCLASPQPEDALRRLVGFTFDHHPGNQGCIRLVMSENMARGSYLAQGVFRTGLDPIDIHASISALRFFNVSNQHSFGLIFKGDNRPST